MLGPLDPRARRGARRPALVSILLATAGLVACAPADPEESAPAAVAPEPRGAQGEAARGARPEIVEALRADLAAARHPSDGAGRAFWLEGSPSVVAGSSARFTLLFEAGPLGVDVGGSVFLQISPFWGWSTPQTERPDRPGYTEVSTSAEGVDLETWTADQQLLAVRISGRPLLAGERLRFVYGAGPALARVDTYAERDERFWVAVDGDGDGLRGLLPAGSTPTVEIVAGPPARLLAILPSTARPGRKVRLHLSVLDAAGNAGVAASGEIALRARTLSGAEEAAGWAVPETVVFEPHHAGVRVVELEAPREPGPVRLEVRGLAGLAGSALSNPMQVAERGRRVLWADLQTHSNFSDGTGLPEDLYAYGRDVAGLDVMSVTDHDHWGLRFLDRSPELWQRIQDTTRGLSEPGRFLALRGFEWTSWIYGHRHVLLFDELPQPVVSYLDPETDHPEELWRALEGRRAITVAHHSAGGPIAIDWSIPPDSALEPVTEVVSVHGSSEGPDSPKGIYRPVAGNYVRDALKRGYRLGFIGSTDGHDGHPGLGHLAGAGVGGLAAILAEEATEEAIYEALLERRTYATSGERILLRAVYGGYLMGAEVPLAPGGGARRDAGDPVAVPAVPADQLLVQVLAPGELDRVDLISSGEAPRSVVCDGQRQCTFALTYEAVEGGFLYVRAVQRDGHFAVSSPFFFGAP
ncbi:MAG: DUF3604 domain-containing protein [Acidobacteriota bacterium]